MTVYIEHANLYVSDLDEGVRFVQTAMPEFEVRGHGVSNDERWVHIGTESSYLALYEASDPESLRTSKLNHIGFVVDDVASTRERLLRAGYQEGFIADVHPARKRLYFLDRDGLEWEFVEYLTEDAAERNVYE